MNRYSFLTFTRICLHCMKKLRFPICLCKPLNTERHKYILSKLNPYLSLARKRTKKSKIKSYNNSHLIWMFWWQGLNNMPPIVKACINSVKRNYVNNKVVVITHKNIDSYVKFPNYILKKLKYGYITLTHFSDLLRFRLLKTYGGLWIDSTVFCTSQITPSKFNHLYTSGGYDNSYNYYVSSKWTGFLIGGNAYNRLFVFMDNFFKIYWETHKFMIDYFLIDYGLYYAYQHNIGGFKYYVDHRAYKNNPHLPVLMSLLNKPFNIKTYRKITEDTNLFKLTYKKLFLHHGTTFYRKLISKDI